MEKRSDGEVPSSPGTLTVLISTEAEREAAATHLVSLRDWLAEEEPLRGRVELRAQRPRPGEMGAALDVLAVGLGSGGAGAVLAQSLSTWLVQRRADVIVRLTRKDGQGVTVEVRRSSDPLAVISAVRQLLEDGQE